MGPPLQVNGHGTLTLRPLRALRAASLSWLPTGAWADDQGVAIDATNFPDANFRSYVLDNCDTDNNGYPSDTEIANVTTISCSNKGISDLKGIECFTFLQRLDCPQNKLASLDVSHNGALKELVCSDNQLGELDVSDKGNLVALYCQSNALTSLDLSHNAHLEDLDCSDNRLTSLSLNQNVPLRIGFSCANNSCTI